MIRNFFILLILITNLLLSQNYLWPTNTGKQLTSNFGEFRDKHFHMGLDIRTDSSIDHPLFAVHDGYIQRISTNFSGYGKALYLKTDDGKIVVYGHLNRFSERLENLLFELQKENQSYYINKHFTKDEYLVNRGGVIGYSGNTGGSTGPHLHFEIRNEKDQPLNPMTIGFPIVDNIPPHILDLSIIPLTSGTQINNSPLPQNYIPIPISPIEYILNDTISIAGTFGMTTRVIDNIKDAPYSYQIEKLDLLVDSTSVFSVQYDLLDFSEGETISTVYGQPINHPKHDDFQKLYRLESYPKLTIHTTDKTGIINLTEGIHKIQLFAWDAAQNKSILNFYIKSDKSTNNVQYTNILKLMDYSTFENGSNVFNPNILQLEKGAIFQLRSDIEGYDKIEAYIEKQDTLLTFPLIKIEVNEYASEMINPYLFNGVEKFGFLLNSDKIQKYEYSLTPVLTLSNDNKKIFSPDSICSITINNSFYDTTLLWITQLSSPTPNCREYSRSNVYTLNPFGIPYKNDIVVSFAFKEDLDLNKYAIYTFNDKKSKWDFEETFIDTIDNFISTKISKPSIFTVFEDNRPPSFSYTNPSNQQIYPKDTFKNFTISLTDDFSGVNSSEEYLIVYLDGKRIWVAYQPVEKEISYNLRSALSVGEHNLMINIQDRSGNSASKSIKFFIE